LARKTVYIFKIIRKLRNGTRTITCGKSPENDAMPYARESPDKEKLTINTKTRYRR